MSHQMTWYILAHVPYVRMPHHYDYTMVHTLTSLIYRDPTVPSYITGCAMFSTSLNTTYILTRVHVPLVCLDVRMKH